MAKNIGCLILILCLLPWNHFGQSRSIECLVRTYRAEVGVKEEGWNRGKRVEEYLSAVHLGKGNPWCAAFVIFCHKECGYQMKGATGWSPSLFPPKKVVTTWKQGDVFGIYFANKKRIAHVGIIDQVERNSVITVEGNTGPDNYGERSREGDGVFKKRRMKKQIYMVSRWHDS